MNNACPECGAVYAVASKDVGRRIACKKCRTLLVVTERGLERDEPITAEPAEEEDAAPSVETERETTSDASGFFARLRNLADVPTYLLGVGAFLSILFLFLPLLDQAKVARREAEVTASEVDTARRLRETKADDEKKRIQENGERRRRELREEADLIRLGTRQADYWNHYGMMLGVLFVAFGALGYLTSGQTLTRRVVGGVLLCSILVLIFWTFLHPPRDRSAESSQTLTAIFTTHYSPLTSPSPNHPPSCPV
jgi:predicted Zn finger-like uncharacterized protein